MSTDALNLTDGWSQQVSSYRFDLLDKEGIFLGDIPVFHGASVENNINRTMKRSISGVSMPPDAINHINLLSDRVRPMMILTDGTEYPLGVFIFSDTSITRVSQGSAQYTTPGSTIGPSSVEMLDQMALLDSAIPTPIAFRPNTLITDCIDSLLQKAATWTPGLTWVLPESNSIIRGTEWFVKAPGTTLLAAINDLCSLGSFYSIYSDNSGVFQVKEVPDLDGDADFVYDYDTTVIADSIVETTDVWNVPNRWIVINTALTERSVYGYWDLPSSSIYSIAARGRVVAEVVDRQGINTNEQAKKTAKTIGTQSQSAYEWVDFEATPNPLHDTFNVVQFEGNMYREQSWNLRLTPGGSHKHELRRTYTPDIEDPLGEFIEDPDAP